MTVLLPEGRVAHFSETGKVLALAPESHEALLVVVERTSGSIELLSLTQFQEEISKRSGSKPPEASLRLLPLNLDQIDSGQSPPQPGNPSSLKSSGRLSDPKIEEASDLLRSPKHAGVFWTISDSGNPPHLYALDAKGTVLARYRVTGAVNLDWEALAADDDGNLYIADVGNNFGLLPVRSIYQVREPDPLSESKDPAERESLKDLPVARRIDFTYPKTQFDCEAASFLGGKLYLVSKTAKTVTELYEVPLAGDGDQPVKLIKVTDLPGVQTITGAALSPDGKRLALTNYNTVAVYDLPSAGSIADLSQQVPLTIPFKAPAIEAINWDADDLLLLGEDGQLYRIKP